ncbi:MAG: hypothetical protein J5590_09895 [Clostridia bacterium]|nr:hypothetical protein [Clostridia bacterium]
MIKNVKKLLLARVFCAVIALFALNLFSFVFSNKFIFVIFTALVMLIYMFYISSIAFENGAKDKRYNRVKPFKAVCESLISEIPAALLLVWLLLSRSSFDVAGFFYDLWQAPFWLLLSVDNVIFNLEKVTPLHFLVLFFIPVLYSVSYLVGVKTTKLLTPAETNKELKG